MIRTTHSLIENEDGVRVATFAAVLAPEPRKGVRWRCAEVGRDGRYDDFARVWQPDAIAAGGNHRCDFGEVFGLRLGFWVMVIGDGRDGAPLRCPVGMRRPSRGPERFERASHRRGCKLPHAEASQFQPLFAHPRGGTEHFGTQFAQRAFRQG